MPSHTLRSGRSGAVSLAVSLAAFATMMSASCTTTAEQASDIPVQINFEARVGDRIAKCGETYAGVGSSKASILLQDFRIYVSEAKLIAKDGREVPVKLTPDNQWQNDSVTLLDFENATGNCNGNAPTNMAIRGTAPAGDYAGISFEIGVPFAINHKDPTLAGAPMNYSGLTWPWRVGYKFTTIDLETESKPADAGAPAPKMGGMMGMHASGFSIHLGSTSCGAGSPTTPPTTPCDNPNRAAYRLVSFNLNKQKVVLDLGALLADTDVTVNAPGSASGCMSFVDDDDCIAIMDRFGLPFRGKASTGQKFVKAS